MKFSFFAPEIKLPPAYVQVEDCLKAAEAIAEFQIRSTDMWAEANNPGSYSDLDEAYELNEWEYLLRNHGSEMFALIFEQEISKGHSEILRAEGFANIFSSNAVNLEASVRSNSKVFEALLSYIEENPKDFAQLVRSFSYAFSTSQLTSLWKLFRSINNISAQDNLRFNLPHYESELYAQAHLRFQELVNGGLNIFFASRNASEEVVLEAYLLIPPNLAPVAAPAWLEVETSISTPTGLQISLSPGMFSEFYPAAFAERIGAAGVDPAVVKMLLPGWDGNTASLMSAAAHLSSDPMV